MIHEVKKLKELQVGRVAVIKDSDGHWHLHGSDGALWPDWWPEPSLGTAVTRAEELSEFLDSQKTKTLLAEQAREAAERSAKK